MILLPLVGVVSLGALLGGIIGAIVTGDWRYTIVWAVALSVAVLCFVVYATISMLRAAGAVRRTFSGGLRAVIAGVLVVVAAVVTLIPAFGSFARIGTDQSLLTGAYQQDAVDQIAKVVGNHDLIDVDFYDGYVIAEAPTKPGARTTDDYQYRYGQAERLGPELIQPEDTRAAVFDGRTVDFSLIPKLITDAERRAKITNPTSLHVSVMQSLDPKAGQPPTINVNVEDAYHEGFVQYSPKGVYLSETGSAFNRG